MANEVFGWTSILFAVGMGLWMGVKFQSEGWLGGYDALPRRMIRLAHVALAALGMLNIEFAHALHGCALSDRWTRVASIGFITAGVSMPVCCLFIASGGRRYGIFALPVGCLGVVLLLTIAGIRR
jgi:hypothetical protein